MKKYIKTAKEIIKKADAILITAGAGMGVDSGLPDFRGNEGFWRAYPPIAKLGISFAEMANPRWFEVNPKLAWAFYGHRLNLYRKTTPHEGFKKLLDLAKSKKGGYFVFTSNVDGQFQKAGFDETKIEECHGSIHHLQCTKSCSDDIWSAKDIEVEVDEKAFEAKEPLPKCKNCNSLARPNILMFGDFGWISDRSQVQANRFQNWLFEIKKKNFKLAIIEIGAGEAVPTVRYTSEHIANSFDGILIRVNPRDYQVPNGHISIALGGLKGVETLC